jgi:ABC-type Zn uptake system ZnuABC Zn-binding protein ZnuA
LVPLKGESLVQSVSLKYILVFSAIFSGILAGCKNTAVDQNESEIAVTNSYLYCVVKDLCGDQTNILCLTPPGMCPGHFDISPAQVNQLCKCRVLFLFDFQKGFEDSLQRIKEKGLNVSPVTALPGFCVPETYLATCRQVCDILSSEYPERQVQYNRRLEQIKMRLGNLANELFTEIRQGGLESAKVVTSDHQSQFCNWLGLETVATFIGSDVERVYNIDRCIKRAKGRDVKFVIANKQGGTALAGALAERLGAEFVVFSNFPEMSDGRDDFDELLRRNVRALFKAAG